jgi:hypothetical protein
MTEKAVENKKKLYFVTSLKPNSNGQYDATAAKTIILARINA